MPKFIDLTGQKINRLTFIEYKNKGNWLCVCNCGNKIIAKSAMIKNNNTKSCGCLKIELTKLRFAKHNHQCNYKQSKTYSSWHQMIQRCTNTNNPAYKNYGGREIKVCKRWSRFENFLKDMGKRPENKTLDRINNSLGYYKENCKWSTKKEQDRNKRTNLVIYYNNQKKCLIEWSEIYNINPKTLSQRIYRSGWTIAKALMTPVKQRKYK